jgi:hypothetical protein
VDDGINEPYVILISGGKAIKQRISPLFIQGNQIVFKTSEEISLPVVVKGQSKISNNTLVNVINDDIDIEINVVSVDQS